MLSYFNWVGNFAKGSGIKKNGYDQSGATKTWWKNLQHSVVPLLETSRFGRGGLSCSLKLTIKSFDHAQFLGAQVVINYSS